MAAALVLAGSLVALVPALRARVVRERLWDGVELRALLHWVP